jgi:transcription termination factor Rho
MAAEQQLERSVLERKERDELRAIAQAMSLETNSRSKKADIIDQILRAAGVEVVPASNGDRKVTTSSRRGQGGAPADADADADADALGDVDGRAAAASSNGHDADGAAVPSTNGASSETESAPDGAPAEGADSRTAVGVDVGGAGAVPSRRQTAAPQGRQQQQGGQGGNEPGNRRSRRRRGRERGPGGGERELQVGGQEAQYQGELVPVRGLLDLRDEGYGFLRAEGYLPSARDVYVSISQARRFALRKGDYVEGACRPAASNEKFPALIRIDTVCALPPEEARARPRFEDLTPLFPDEHLRLETSGAAEVTTRIIDLLSPIGKGQRGMIVSPPKAGKTTILKQIAHSIEDNNPEVHLIVLLVDERPEEVTDMRRSVKGEVVASTFDRPSDEHTAIAELTIERAKRLVELGKDVVIVLDGITRLARAYNLAQPATGRIMSGGVDSGALYPPKKFFGAARNIEEGGSLTILATALVETGSKMDEVIFEEFKGTGNMELRLDRRLAERRLYPSIDVNASSTRHEELLFDRGALQQVWKLRRVLNALAADGNAAAGLELLVDKIRSTKSNDEFLAEIAKGPTPAI